jgi:hypothetical protein
MNEPLLERIRLLERANRLWKRATLGLAFAVILLLGLWAGLGIRLLFESLPGLRVRALQAELEARMQIELAEAERRRAEENLRKVESERRRAGEQAR